MAYRCSVCGKKAMRGHNVSHAKNRTARRFKLSLRFARLKFDGLVKKVRICAKCLKRAKLDKRYVLPKIRLKVNVVTPIVKEVAPVEATETIVKKKVVVKKKIIPKTAPA